MRITSAGDGCQGGTNVCMAGFTTVGAHNTNIRAIFERVDELM